MQSPPAEPSGADNVELQSDFQEPAPTRMDPVNMEFIQSPQSLPQVPRIGDHFDAVTANGDLSQDCNDDFLSTISLAPFDHPTVDFSQAAPLHDMMTPMTQRETPNDRLRRTSTVQHISQTIQPILVSPGRLSCQDRRDSDIYSSLSPSRFQLSQGTDQVSFSALVEEACKSYVAKSAGFVEQTEQGDLSRLWMDTPNSNNSAIRSLKILSNLASIAVNLTSAYSNFTKYVYGTVSRSFARCINHQH